MIRILQGDAQTMLATLPDASVQCCVNDGRFKKGERRSPATEFKPGQHWRPHGRHRDKSWLEGQYLALGRSTGDIGKEVGFCGATIVFWLRKHGIPRRSISEARAIKRWGQVGSANPMFGKTGALNPGYINGSSPERQRAYVQCEGREFLRAIYKRDGYRCTRCGAANTKPRSLHAHHIKSWAGNKELRFDRNNVVTLCRQCHSWVHSKRNTARDFLHD